MAIVRALATDPRALLLGEVCFLHEGRVLVRGPAEQVLSAPERPETRRFLRRLLEAR